MSDQGKPMLLRAEEVARELGISRSKVFMMLAKDEIPGVVRIDRILRVSRESLENWVRERASPESVERAA